MKFNLASVLTVTECHFLVEDMQEVYEILNFLTGESLEGEDLTDAVIKCKPWILKNFPQLKKVDTSSVDEKNYKQFLKKQIARFGDEFELQPCPKQ